MSTGDNLVDLSTRRHLLPRSRWVRRLVAVLILAVLAALVWLVLVSSVLGVRTVRVEGGHKSLRSQVLRALAVTPGQPLARVSVTAAAQRVTTEVPTVRQVTVTRQWPSTITVSVTPRVAVITMRAGSEWDRLDDQGVVVSRSTTTPARLPILTTAGDPAAVLSAATVVAALPPALHARVQTLIAHTQDAVTLRTADGRTIVWGSAEQSEQKARVLAALLHQKASVYDVSSPELPTTSN